MKFSIGNRLFLAVLLAFLAVAALGVGLVRWRLLDSDSARMPDAELDHLAGLVSAVSAHYKRHPDWSFLPATPEKRKTWLREELARSPQDADAQTGAKTHLPGLGYRIGLLDRNKHYLAGAIANPIIVAFASIDTVQRAVVVDGETVGYLVLAKPESPDGELAVAFLIQQQGSLAVVAVIGIVLSALSAALLAANFRRPIRQLVAGARRLGNAQFDTRLSTKRNDELGELGDAFNRLAARLQDAERSRQQWIADTSHELRTPLSVVRGQVEALQDGVRTATPENIALLLRQILALTKLVDELYELARADVGQRHYARVASDVWQLVRDAVDGFSEKFRGAGLCVNVGATPVRSTVRCDVDRMHQVVTNLLENCVRYTRAGGTVEVNASVVGDGLNIVVEDSAPGVPEQWLDRLGERFFRVDSSRSRQLGGAGLGLALCRQILDAHDGRLDFSPSPLGGLRATIVLKLES